MENEKRAYLDKIAQDNRGAEKVESSLPINPKLLIKILGIVFGVLFLLLGVAAISNSLNRDTVQERDLVDQISYRMANLSGTVEKYRKDVRSTTLRADIVTLQGLFAKTIQDLDLVLADGNFSGEANVSVIESEEEYMAGVEETLEKARMNGTLDRTMNRQLILEIALILTMEDECLSRTEDENLTMVLNESHKELEERYEQLDQTSSGL